MCEPLVFLPVTRWTELSTAFKNDWPRCVSGCNVLETQQRWKEMGLKYNFTVYCPFGEVQYGMVGISEKNFFNEIILICPQNDTSKLEEALLNTKLVDWNHRILVPFAPQNVIECLRRIAEKKNVNLNLYLGDGLILEADKPIFGDGSLPPDVTIDYLSMDNAELINDKWPHKYRNSIKYFELLINNKCGFGLFKQNQLVCWAFINESGNVGHLFTLEEHRRNGYAETLMKIISNRLLGDKKPVVVYCVKENDTARQMYEKLGFKKIGDIAWCLLTCNNDTQVL